MYVLNLTTLRHVTGFLSSNENRDMPQRTIVRLVNRKACESALKNRKKLKQSNKIALGFPEDTKLFINDSLCPYYRVLYGKCKKLYKNGDIVNFAHTTVWLRSEFEKMVTLQYKHPP